MRIVWIPMLVVRNITRWVWSRKLDPDQRMVAAKDGEVKPGFHMLMQRQLTALVPTQQTAASPFLQESIIKPSKGFPLWWWGWFARLFWPRIERVVLCCRPPPSSIPLSFFLSKAKKRATLPLSISSLIFYSMTNCVVLRIIEAHLAI